MFEEKRIKIGVIPVGGKGERISPLSELLPKPMIPVLDRPILELIIKRMVQEFGVSEIYFILAHKKEVIKDYFGDGKKFGAKIRYIEERNPRGIAPAIALAKEYIKEPFLVMLGDDFTLGSAKNLIKTFFEKKAYVVEGIVKERDIEALKRTCSVIQGRDKKIKDIVEKPEKPTSKLRGCGIYIFDPIVFDYIKKTPKNPKSGKINITDTIGILAKEQKAYAEFIKGTNININTKEELFLANLLLAKILEKNNQINLEKVDKHLGLRKRFLK